MQDFPLQIIYKVKAGKKFQESNLSSNKAVQINNATSNPSTSLSRTLLKKKKKKVNEDPPNVKDHTTFPNQLRTKFPSFKPPS